jgi:hypothetical protein
MRIEMLGTGFTAQHSDARVLNQLVYKWSHSRSVIAKVLSEEYAKLCESGWILTTRRSSTLWWSIRRVHVQVVDLDAVSVCHCTTLEDNIMLAVSI